MVLPAYQGTVFRRPERTSRTAAKASRTAQVSREMRRVDIDDSSGIELKPGEGNGRKGDAIDNNRRRAC
jgi:hypothetical protein